MPFARLEVPRAAVSGAAGTGVQMREVFELDTAKAGLQENRDFELDCKFLSRQAASVKSFLKISGG